jgi:4-hydroxy-4-methyl-2-oxoglutarate aldolase
LSEGFEIDPKDAVRRLRRLDCCAGSDALDRLKLGGVVSGVPQQSGDTRIAGRAITLKLGIGTSSKGPPRHLGTAALDAAGSDDVIVVEQRSGIEAGSWGGLLTLGAKLRGVAGVVCDGPVRDIDEARAQGFPIFARALTARTAHGRIVELGTNVPILFETVKVEPGDYVIADRSAVIFIAAPDIARVLAAGETITAKEAAMAKALLAGESISQVMAADYEQMLRSRTIPLS